MRILLLTEFFPSLNNPIITGGIESRVYNLAQEFCKKNQVLVLTSKQPGSKNEKLNNIDIHRIGPTFEYSNTGKLLQRVVFGIALMLYILKISKRDDIIDAQSYFVYPAGLIAALFGRKVFFTYHEVWINSWIKNTKSNLGLFGEVLERILLIGIQLLKIPLISVSKETKNKLLHRGISNVHVIANGIHLGKKYKKKIKKTICFIGRLVEHKRVQDILLAVSKIKDVHLIVVGKGPYEKQLKNKAQELNIEERVSFIGFIKDHKDVLKIMGSSHLLIHPGTVEGFGIVLIESLAQETPYVASDIQVFKEITQNGKGGLLFKTRDIDQLQIQIQKLLSNKRRYEEKIKEGKNLIKKYQWDHIAKSLISLYKARFL